MKYYIVRKSKYTGRIEYKMHKTLDNWCSEALKANCWTFTKAGAQKYIQRQIDRGWHCEYWLEEAQA